MAKVNRTGAARDAAPQMVGIEVLSPIDYDGQRFDVDSMQEVDASAVDELVRIGAARLADVSAPVAKAASGQDGT